MLDNA